MKLSRPVSCGHPLPPNRGRWHGPANNRLRHTHSDAGKLAREFGAADIVTERGDDAAAEIKDLTGGGQTLYVTDGRGLVQVRRSGKPTVRSRT